MTRRLLLLGALAAFVLLLVWMAGGMFGEHSYRHGSGIHDPMVEPYMPEGATEVTVLKELGGHCALYKISEADLKAFVAGLWASHRESYAAEGRKGGWLEYSDEDVAGALQATPVGRLKYRESVQKLGWPTLENAVRYEGPRRASAAGADYYYDREAGIAYHDAGYW